MGKNEGENELSGLNSNTLKPLSFKLDRGNASKSPCSCSPISICQSTGILMIRSAIFNTSAGELKDSKKISGMKW